MWKFSNLRIVTHSKIFYEGEVLFVKLTTKSGGEIVLQPNRSEFLSTIDVCELAISTYPSGEELICSISDGIVYANDSNIHIISNEIIFKEDIDVNKAIKERDEALIGIKQAKTDKEEKIFEFELKKAINKINVSEKN